MAKKGKLFIVSAPSGAGKTSLVRTLIEQHPDIAVAVSHTTRDKRPDERDGENYFFTDREQFESMISAEKFLEYARVFDNYYGTSRAEVLRHQDAGKHIILEIDWQGANQVRQLVRKSESIFILPPSLEVLKARLTKRGQDNEASIAKRTAAAMAEISHYHEFDYLIVNDLFDQALDQLATIVEGDGGAYRTASQRSSLNPLLDQLLTGSA